jgi:hypothetical protein
MANIITLKPHARDLGGGFMVRRLLPAAERQSVGPFLFFDHFGPMDVAPEVNQDVRPHPHIGLATVTYLFEGAILHRDNVGSVQRRPTWWVVRAARMACSCGRRCRSRMRRTPPLSSTRRRWPCLRSTSVGRAFAC